MILNVDFALKLSNYSTSLRRVLCLKWILKISPQHYILSSTIIHCRSIPLKGFKGNLNWSSSTGPFTPQSIMWKISLHFSGWESVKFWQYAPLFSKQIYTVHVNWKLIWCIFDETKFFIWYRKNNSSQERFKTFCFSSNFLLDCYASFYLIERPWRNCSTSSSPPSRRTTRTRTHQSPCISWQLFSFSTRYSPYRMSILG